MTIQTGSMTDSFTRSEEGSGRVVFAVRLKHVSTAAMDCCGGALRRKPGIGFSILTGLSALV